MFHFGEVGYDNEGSFLTLDEAIQAAKEHSIASGEAAVEVTNSEGDRSHVCVEGEVFELVQEFYK